MHNYHPCIDDETYWQMIDHFNERYHHDLEEEILRQQEEQEYLSEIAVKLMTEDTE